MTDIDVSVRGHVALTGGQSESQPRAYKGPLLPPISAANRCHPKTVGVQRNQPIPKNRSKGWFSSSTNDTTFSHAGFEILKVSRLVVRQQISETREFAKCIVFQRGTSRYVFTTDVSVNEVQAFIRDLVLVLGWFTPLDRYGR